MTSLLHYVFIVCFLFGLFCFLMFLALYCVSLFTAFSTGQKKVGHISKYKAHILKFLRPIFPFLKGRM